MENPLASLQALSQAIGQTESSEAVYILVQQTLARLMGDGVGMVVAHHDADNKQIKMPFVWVDGQRRQLPAYEYHEDTLSQVILTGRPILLTQALDGIDSKGGGQVGTSSFSRERFANIRFTSRTAYSVMAVPFLVPGKVFGALAVIDYVEEGRFSEDDLSFITVVAGQMAAREQALHLSSDSQERIQRDRLLYEATTKIRSSVDMQTILENTAKELGRILEANRVHIEINLPKLFNAETDVAENPVDIVASEE